MKYKSNRRAASTRCDIPRAVQPEATRSHLRPWHAVVAALGFLLLALEVYGPALKGPFLFDDIGLPFYSRSFAEQPLTAWLAGVRPVLMFSYWVNFQLSAYEPLSYHVFNVLLHAANSTLLLLLFHRILTLCGIPNVRSGLLAAAGAALFLLHPLQTEAVAYIAGRSELVCGLFTLSALVVFLRQPSHNMSWPAVASIILLYVFAVASKEQAVVLPVVLLAADMFLYRRNAWESLNARRRLYQVVGVAALFGLVLVAMVLQMSGSAGAHVVGFTWYDYFWTQCRVWFWYLALFLLPFSQNADYDIPISRTPLEHGAIAGLIGMAVLVVLAWRARHRYPIAVLGFFVFLVLLAPTSSFVPIQDVAAERRMYLPVAGLLLIAIDLLSRVRVGATVVGAIAVALIALGALSYHRSRLWGDDVLLWSDTASKSPNKMRAYTHLMFAYIRKGRCNEALENVANFPPAVQFTPEFLGAWGAAFDCAQKPEEALERYRRAAEVAPGVGTYLKLAIACERQGKMDEAQIAAARGLQMQPRTPFDHATLDAYHAIGQTRSRSATPQ